MPRKKKGTTAPVDRDKLVVSWIEKQETDIEPAPANDRVIEMPSAEERRRRLEKVRNPANGKDPGPRI
jgi:hypothetical protein